MTLNKLLYCTCLINGRATVDMHFPGCCCDAAAHCAVSAYSQGDEPTLAEDELRELLGHNVMPLLRLLYAQAGASCCALARALSCSCPKQQACPGRSGHAGN